MARVVRNTVERSDARWIAGIAAVSAVLAAVAGCRPTGNTAADAVICLAVGAVVAWAGATAPWWILVAAGAVVAMAASTGPVVLVLAGWVAVFGGLWLGSRRISMAPLRAALAALVVQVALRLEWNPFFLASGLVAALALVPVVVYGVIRRPGYVRRRVWWSLAGFGAVALVAMAGAGVGGAQARGPAVAGYRELLVSLDYLQDGRIELASASLRKAAADLVAADRALQQPWTQVGLVVPVVAQNQRTMAEVIGRGAEIVTAAADSIELVDLEQLQIVDGQVNLAAMELLRRPLADLDAKMAELQAVLVDAESVWLIPPFRTRIDVLSTRADQMAHQARATARLAEIGPAMLGADGPRRYLLLFTNPGESRATSGLMGNWVELLVHEGRLAKDASGRSAELTRALEEGPPLHVEVGEDYFFRYGAWGSGNSEVPMHPKFWNAMTMSPDMPSVGTVTAQMYEAATRRSVDGVFIVDPAGIAALLSVTGPVSVPELDVTLGAHNVERYLLLDQYEAPEADRERALEAVTEATVDLLLASILPPPQTLAQAMSTAALEGHLTGWMVRPEEQELLAIVGMEGALPPLGERVHPSTRTDGLAVANQNSNGNKIDSFLQREITYRPVYRGRDGWVTATLEVALVNSSPTSGLDDYVIGNLIGLPTGTNFAGVEVFTALDLVSATVAGEEVETLRQWELGWNVYSRWVEVPPGASVTLTMVLEGWVAPGGYELVVRPQALPNPDFYTVVAGRSGGGTLWEFEGPLARRTVLDADGVRAWR